MLPYTTPDNQSISGAIKKEISDFQVEEIPAYEPSGKGEHLFVFIEKHGLSTQEVLEALSHLPGVSINQIGYAGMKDRQGITRQWFSIHTPDKLPLHLIESPQLKVLKESRHFNKLKPGHLKGNQFNVLLRDVNIRGDFEILWNQVILRGFPNYYGEQRFGWGNQNVVKGWDILKTKAKKTPRNKKNKFFLQAFQSAIFNHQLSTRINAQIPFNEPQLGDLAYIHLSGAVFSVDTSDTLAQCKKRAETGEISPSGFLPGYKVSQAEGDCGKMEKEILSRLGLTFSDFFLDRKKMSLKGERRSFRSFAKNPTYSFEPLNSSKNIRFQFSLPSGVFATTFLREFMKNDQQQDLLPFILETLP